MNNGYRRNDGTMITVVVRMRPVSFEGAGVRTDAGSLGRARRGFGLLADSIAEGL